MTKRYGAKDPVAIRIFHPYVHPPGSLAATTHERYVGRTNEMSIIFTDPTTVELRVHDETTPGGFPICEPEAPAVSADADNSLSLGSDGLLFYDETANLDDVMGNDGTTVLFKVHSA